MYYDITASHSGTHGNHGWCALLRNKGMATLKRADKEALEKVFKKYASVERDGERFMSPSDLVSGYLRLAEGVGPDGMETVLLLASLADTTGNKLISFSEFRAFESLLCTPDAINRLAFNLFDTQKDGRIKFDNFKSVLSATSIHKSVPFDFSSSFVTTYFGNKRQCQLDYYEFSQILQSLPTEHARQAFTSRDIKRTGSIPALEFVELMKKTRGFRMSKYVQDNLLSVAAGSSSKQVSYAYFKAFNQFLGNLDILEKIVEGATTKLESSKVTEAQLLQEAQQYAQVTPLQMSLLFNLCSLDEQTTGSIGLEDFRKLLPDSRKLTTTVPLPQPQVVVEESNGVSPWVKAVEPVYRFVLAGVGGATGATTVYPIDLVKTRLQNQRGSLAGEIMYKNSLDCAMKVLKNEGFFGLYRGLLPQLVGVSPEKAIKLTTNDTMRDFFTDKEGNIQLWQESIAGGCGGMCQVMFTNPIEIVKIRLQVAGEMAETSRLGAGRVMRDLGFRGLYKGASACFLRDIPFSAIYFPLYAHMKKWTSNAQGYNGVASLFFSGFIAGVPAAGLLTPADVIKTRLQVVARKGQQTYTGLTDCFRKILKTEGPRAFWKGAPARILRSSPQFGVTLATYELLQRLFYVDFGKGKQHGKQAPPTKPIDHAPYHRPDHIGGFKLANAAFAGMESRFGLVFPK